MVVLERFIAVAPPRETFNYNQTFYEMYHNNFETHFWDMQIGDSNQWVEEMLKECDLITIVEDNIYALNDNGRKFKELKTYTAYQQYTKQEKQLEQNRIARKDEIEILTIKKLKHDLKWYKRLAVILGIILLLENILIGVFRIIRDFINQNK